MMNARGFVMADAIMALLVISVAMTALIGLTVTSAKSSQKADTRLTATTIARAVAEDPSVRDDEGQFRVDGRDYRWTRTIEATRVTETTRLQLERISVQVHWSEKSDGNQITYNTARWRVPHAS